jgi:hypothetical protein
MKCVARRRLLASAIHPWMQEHQSTVFLSHLSRAKTSFEGRADNITVRNPMENVGTIVSNQRIAVRKEKGVE